MSARPTLTLARAPRRPAGPSFSMMKKALRLYRGPGIPKATVHANARKWLASMAALGDNHILNRKAPAKWGVAGEPGVHQVFAPRRLGGASQ